MKYLPLAMVVVCGAANASVITENTTSNTDSIVKSNVTAVLDRSNTAFTASYAGQANAKASTLANVATGVAKSNIAGVKPSFSTDVQFHKFVCGSDGIKIIEHITKMTEFFGAAKNKTGVKIDSSKSLLENGANAISSSANIGQFNTNINKKITDGLSTSLAQSTGKTNVFGLNALNAETVKDGITNAAQVTAQAFNIVNFSLTPKATCTDTATEKVAQFDLNAGVTLKLDTRIFDPAIHAASGVTPVAGVDISIYELIPFRIYGDIALTTGVNTRANLTYSNTDKVFSKVGAQIANKSSIAVEPAIDLGLGVDAYARVPSFASFLPDILQVGVNLDVNVIKFAMPLTFSETLKAEGDNRLGVIASKTNTAAYTFTSGDGQLKPFLNIFGIAVDAFNGYVKTWEGYKKSQNFDLAALGAKNS